MKKPPRESFRIVNEPELKLVCKIEGNCPVQAEGTINGHQFYFRARGNQWSFSLRIDPKEDPILIETNENGYFMEAEYETSPYGAGWMPLDEAEIFIKKCAQEFLFRNQDLGSVF